MREQNRSIVDVKTEKRLKKYFKCFKIKMHINAIHPSSPNSSLSEDDAAVKIQAGYRGYRVRKQLKNKKSKNYQNGQSKDYALEEKSAAQIQAAWKGFRARRQLKCAKEAATKIQASFRGFRTRKELKKKFSKDDFFRKSQ